MTTFEIERATVAGGASGRNGGFVSYSITHTLENGVSRFPDEIDELECQGMDSYRGLVNAVERYGIDAELEPAAMILLARAPHQTAWFPEAVEQHARFGYPAEILDRAATQEVLRSPTYIGALRIGGDGHAPVHPAKLAWGLRDAALSLGVRIHERSPVRALEREAGGVRVRTREGSVLAERVVLATNAYPPLLRRIRSYVVPVYDHVLMTEPLSAEQRAAIGWTGREGLGDAANRFHYFRLSADDRILWGGYDAIYHPGNRVHPGHDLRPATFATLERNFAATFPQLAKDSVTAGNCPKWLMVSGPVCRRVATTESSGTSEPPDDRKRRQPSPSITRAPRPQQQTLRGRLHPRQPSEAAGPEIRSTRQRAPTESAQP